LENITSLNTSDNSKKIKKENKISHQQNLEKMLDIKNINLEYLLQDLDKVFGENKQSYMLFELLLFALTSNENMKNIENKILHSKIIFKILQDFNFDVLKNHKEKYLVTKFIDNIKSFEKTIFQSKIKFNITFDKFMPTYFIFDAPKIQSIILLLIMDLEDFIDHTQPINISLTHNTKLLYIKIEGSLLENHSILSSITGKKKFKNISERPALQIAVELSDSIDQEIASTYTKTSYSFSLDVPIS